LKISLFKICCKHIGYPAASQIVNWRFGAIRVLQAWKNMRPNHNQKKEALGAKEKKCHFCEQGLADLDYKDGTLLRKFTSSYAKIMPIRRTHLCAKHQRKLAEAIKRARVMAILPFVNR